MNNRSDLRRMTDFPKAAELTERDNHFFVLKNSRALALIGFIFFASLALAVDARESSEALSIQYVLPENPQHQPIYEQLRERRMLERLEEFLSPFQLSRPLRLTLTGCDGEADAFYGDDEITICYEYIEELQRFMPAETTAAGIEPIDTVIGPFMDTVLHEFAHALFDILDLPVLGREEDAADQVSAFTYLQLGPSEARRLITGTIYAYMLEVQDTDPPSPEEFADEHSTSEQRAFNLMCIAYGADANLFEDVVKLGGLPQARIEICEEEYEQIAYAYESLIGPHIDADLAREVFDKSWLPKKTWRMLQ